MQLTFYSFLPLPFPLVIFHVSAFGGTHAVTRAEADPCFIPPPTAMVKLEEARVCNHYPFLILHRTPEGRLPIFFFTNQSAVVAGRLVVRCCRAREAEQKHIVTPCSSPHPHTLANNRLQGSAHQTLMTPKVGGRGFISAHRRGTQPLSEHSRLRRWRFESWLSTMWVFKQAGDSTSDSPQ